MITEKMVAETEEVQTVRASTFTKTQLLVSKRFANRRDLLNAVLSDGENYTMEVVEQKMKEFYERKGE